LFIAPKADNTACIAENVDPIPEWGTLLKMAVFWNIGIILSFLGRGVKRKEKCPGGAGRRGTANLCGIPRRNRPAVKI